MNASAVIAVAIVTAVVSGVLAFVTLARPSDMRGAGLLSAETCRRDQAARTDAHSPALTDSTIAAAAPTSQIRRDVLATAVPRQWKRLPAKRSGMFEAAIRAVSTRGIPTFVWFLQEQSDQTDASVTGASVRTPERGTFSAPPKGVSARVRNRRQRLHRVTDTLDLPKK